MKKNNNRSIFIFICIFILFIIFSTILFELNKINYNNENYIDFTNNWYSNNEKVKLSEVYKYNKVSKKLPKVNDDTKLSLMVKNVDIDIYVGNKIIFDYSSKNNNDSSSNSYFINIDLKEEYSNQEISIRTNNTNSIVKGKITEVYIGESKDIILNIVSEHLIGIIFSSIIVFVGLVLIVIYFISKSHNIISIKLLYLGAFAAFSGLFIFMSSSLSQMLTKTGYMYNLIYETCILIMILCILQFSFSTLKKVSNKFIVNFIYILNIINYIICYVIILFGKTKMYGVVLFSNIVYGLCVFYLIYISIKSLRKREEKYNAGGLLFVSIGYIIDMLISFNSIVIEPYFFTRIGVFILLCLGGVQILLNFLKRYRDQNEKAILQKLAYEDGLTGLLNRTSFMDELEELKDYKQGLIAVLDINDLKNVNDTYGHLEGDNLIKEAASNIDDYLSSFGKCYRIGGDEFVFISKESDIEEKFNYTCKKLLNHIDRHNKISGKPYELRLAMGYSVISKKNPINKAFQVADSNMYENKMNIKNKNLD